MMKTPVGYFRISSEDTALDKFAVAKYKQKFLDYGIPESYIFFDFSSGGNINRDEYRKVIELIKSGERNELVVPMQSRLNRNLINSELLAEDLIKAGASLTILETGSTLDLTVPAQRLLYQIQAIFDHQALATYKQQNADNAQARRKQKKLNKVPFGYVLVRGEPAIDHEPFVCLIETKEVKCPADVLLELIEAMLKSKSLTKAVRQVHFKYGVLEFISGRIATNARKKKKQFNFNNDDRFRHKKPIHFSKNTVKRLLSNPLLVGDVHYFWKDDSRPTEIHYDAYPDAAIISRSTFSQLQLAMGFRSYTGTGKKNLPLTGLTYCSSCAARYYSHPGAIRKDGSRRPYYFCANSKNGCQQRAIGAADIEAVVIEQLMRRAKEISLLATEEQDNLLVNPEVKKLKAEIEQLLALNSDNEYIKKAIQDNRQKIQDLTLKSIAGRELQQENLELLQSVFSNSLYWETLKDIEKKEIFKILVNKIVIGIKDNSSYVEEILLNV